MPARIPPPTRLQEAITVCRALLATLERNGSVIAALRQAERLGDLTEDDFIRAYCRLGLEPSRSSTELQSALTRIRRDRGPEASGIFRFLEDTTTTGPSLGSQLKRNGDISLSTLSMSITEAETFVSSARKRVKYTQGETGFRESVEQCETVLSHARNRLHRYASAKLSRLLFEEIPERVLNETRRMVDGFLATSCPPALEKFGVAHEELIANSSENWSNACTAVRRILLDIADTLYPATNESIEGRKLGPAEYKNRLWAYAKMKLTSESRRQTVFAELDDVGGRIDAIYSQSNKGVHAAVTRDEAERLIVRTYLLIADLI
jgi:hypothetical protein